MVGAPFQFLEAGAAPKDDPVDDCMDKQILRCAFVEGCFVIEHAVGDHLLPFWNYFVLFHHICHYFNVVYIC